MEKSSLQAQLKRADTLPNTPSLSNMLYKSAWNRLVLPSWNDHRTPSLRARRSLWSTGVSMDSAPERGWTQELITLPDFSTEKLQFTECRAASQQKRCSFCRQYGLYNRPAPDFVFTSEKPGAQASSRPAAGLATWAFSPRGPSLTSR